VEIKVEILQVPVLGTVSVFRNYLQKGGEWRGGKDCGWHRFIQASQT